MSRKTIAPSFDTILDSLRAAGFEVTDSSAAEDPKHVSPKQGSPKKVSKYGCAAILSAPPAVEKTAAVLLMAKPGVLLGGEISRLLDRGNQKFLKTSKMEVPATADHLRAVHRFSEELTQVTGGTSLYNESLGTVSDRYVYDRLKGRNLPEAERALRPWELPPENGK